MAHLIAKYTEGATAEDLMRSSATMDPIVADSLRREISMRRMLNNDFSGREYATSTIPKHPAYMYDLPSPRKVPQVGLPTSSPSSSKSVDLASSYGLKGSYTSSLSSSSPKEPFSVSKALDYPGLSSNGYMSEPKRIYSVPNGLSTSSGSYTSSKDLGLSNGVSKSVSSSRTNGYSDYSRRIADLDIPDLRDLSIYATLPRGKARDTLAKAYGATSSAYSNGHIEPYSSKVSSPPTKPRTVQRSSNMPTSNVTREHFGTDSYYLNKMAGVLDRFPIGGPMFTSSPSRITDYMYVGGYNDAENWPYLRRLGITHVLNMAGPRRSTSNPYPPESGIVGYEMVDADDSEYYDVMQHFPRAKAFIDKAKYGRGKVLVHCAMGINRSGTMCCAYLMVEEHMALMDAVRRMKTCRGTTLTNRAFQKQLLRYARLKGFL